MDQLLALAKLRTGGVDVYAGPVLYETGTGNSVARALFVQDPRGHIFVLTPKPTEAAFLAAFPGATSVANIA